jgi:hypothetical protein
MEGHVQEGHVQEGHVQEGVASHRSERDRRLNAASCGLISVWLGVSMFIHVDGGVFLLGAGAIILAIQALRYAFNLGVNGFWVMCGCLICTGGVWKILNVSLEFLPVVCIAVGVTCLATMLAGVRKR